MKIYALIPDDYLREASVNGFSFETKCTLAKNDGGEMTLIITISDAEGKVKGGTQYIADLCEQASS